MTIVGRVGSPLLGLDLGPLKDLDRGWTAERHHAELLGVGQVDGEVGEVGVGVAQQCVAPGDEFVSVLVAGAEHSAEHAHGEFFGDGTNKVELGVFECFFNDLDGEFADLVLVALDSATGETLADQPAITSVFRRIELHECAAGFGLFGVHLFEANALGRGERGYVTADRERIVVPQDRPEPGAVLFVGPVDGVFGAQPGEGGVGYAVYVGVMAGDVGVVGAEVVQVVIDKAHCGSSTSGLVARGSAAMGFGPAHTVVPPCIELPTWR